MKKKLAELTGKFKHWLRDNCVDAMIAVFAVVFGCVRSLADYVYDKNELKIDFCESMVYAVLGYALMKFFYYAANYEYKIKRNTAKMPLTLWLQFTGLFLGAYVVCWLTYWPGTVSMDNWYIMADVLNTPLHPTFYCAFVGLFVKLGDWLGSITYGIALYALLQMACLAAAMGFMFVFIFGQKIPSWLKNLLLAIVVLHPFYAIYAITAVKDIYWSAAIVVWTMLIYDLLKEKSLLNHKYFSFLWYLALFIAVVFRSNGPFVVLGTLAVLYFCVKQKELIVLSIEVAFLLCLVSFVWMKTLNISPLFQEKVGIPLQQVAATIKNDGYLTAEQKDYFNNLMPLDRVKELYNPYSTNSIKWNEEESGFDRAFLNKHPSLFLKYWGQALPSNFAIYVKAYLQATYWFWAPKLSNWIDVFYEKTPILAEDKYFLRDTVREKNYFEITVYPQAVQNFLQQFYSKARLFPKDGVWFWLLAGCALLYYLKFRRWKDLLIYLPCFLTWLSLMLATGIAQSIRYVLPLIYLWPFFMVLLFASTQKSGKRVYAVQNYNKWPHVVKRRVRYGLKLCLCLLIAVWGFCFDFPQMFVLARVDVLSADVGHSLFEVRINGKGSPVPEAKWMFDFNYRGVMIQRDHKVIEFTIAALEDSKIAIRLMGPYDVKDGNLRPRWVRYTDFYINDEQIIFDNVDVWHNQPYEYVLEAEKNQIYKIKLKWQRL